MQSGQNLGDDFISSTISIFARASHESLALGVPIFYRDAESGIDIMERPDDCCRPKWRGKSTLIRDYEFEGKHNLLDTDAIAKRMNPETPPPGSGNSRGARSDQPHARLLIEAEGGVIVHHEVSLPFLIQQLVDSLKP